MAKCLICQSEDNEIIRRKLRHDIERDVLRCHRCGFVFLRPLGQASNFYKDNKAYRGKYGPDLKNLSGDCRQMFDIYYPFQPDIIKEVEHLLAPDVKVLDIGCATGHFLHALRGKAKIRVGIELNQAQAEFIKNNLDFKVYSQPIAELDLAEGPFDLITGLQVLEHVEKPLDFLQQIAGHLKEGGYLYLEVPNIDDVLLSVYRVKAYEDFYYREPHLSYFSKDTLKKLLDQAGFTGEIKTVQRYNFLNHLHWLLTGRAQENFAIGNSEPKLAADDVKPGKIKDELNNFIKKADEEYKKLLIKHHLGESISFLGQRKK